MFSWIITVAFLVFITVVTVLSYRLGRTKSESANVAAVIGFLLSFIPPFALIYLIVLSLKEDAATV